MSFSTCFLVPMSSFPMPLLPQKKNCYMTLMTSYWIHTMSSIIWNIFLHANTLDVLLDMTLTCFRLPLASFLTSSIIWNFFLSTPMPCHPMLPLLLLPLLYCHSFHPLWFIVTILSFPIFPPTSPLVPNTIKIVFGHSSNVNETSHKPKCRNLF
jgi:hypothetical protein